MREAVNLTGRGDLTYVLQEPFGFKDWNDELRGKRKQTLPFRPEEPSVA